MDHLKAIRTFVRIIDEGGFASAARAMDVAPAAVTRTLSDLETYLGTRLIDRTKHRLALTDIGEQYLDRTRAILAEVSSAEDLVSSAHNEPSGTLRLRAPAAFAIHQLAKHLPRFHALYPRVTVEVCTLSALDDVDEGHDLSILWSHRPREGDFIARRLACAEVILCASPDYLDRYGRPAHPRELSEHMLLLPPTVNGRQNEPSFTSHPIGPDAQQRERWTVKPQARAPMSTMNAELSYAGALSGLGVCGLPSFVVEDAILESALERVMPAWRLHELTIWACMPARKQVTPRTRALLDFMVTTFGGEPQDPWLNHVACDARI
jgi:DNA-binding transcriptional LysR family regulator